MNLNRTGKGQKKVLLVEAVDIGIKKKRVPKDVIERGREIDMMLIQAPVVIANTIEHVVQQKKSTESSPVWTRQRTSLGV